MKLIPTREIIKTIKPFFAKMCYTCSCKFTRELMYQVEITTQSYTGLETRILYFCQECVSSPSKSHSYEKITRTLNLKFPCREISAHQPESKGESK